MTTQDTTFLGITLPVVGSQEPFRVADYNAAFETVDNWAVSVNTGLGATALLESGLAAGTKSHAAAGLTGVVPLTKGGTGGTTRATALAALGIYVQATQPTDMTAGNLWFYWA